MSKIYVVYWSQTGNTQAMAEAIGKGVVNGGKEAEVINVAQASIDMLKEASVIAIGCPAMGAEVLEESEMEPFICDFEKVMSGKNIALFGSYGWGDGQWMRDWEERTRNSGANLINNEGLMCHEVPDEDMISECIALGKQLANY